MEAEQTYTKAFALYYSGLELRLNSGDMEKLENTLSLSHVDVKH